MECGPVSLLLRMAIVNALLTQAVHPRAAADGELRFMPAAPRPGQSVSATYSPPRGLAGAERVSLRARLRTIHGNVYSEPPYAAEGTDVITDEEARHREAGRRASCLCLTSDPPQEQRLPGGRHRLSSPQPLEQESKRANTPSPAVTTTARNPRLATKSPNSTAQR